MSEDVFARIEAERALLGEANWKALAGLEFRMMTRRLVAGLTQQGDSLLRKRRRVRRHLLHDAGVRRHRDLAPAWGAAPRTDDVSVLFGRLERHLLQRFAWPPKPVPTVPTPVPVPAALPAPQEPCISPANPFDTNEELPAPNADGGYTGTAEQLMLLIERGRIPRNVSREQRIW